MTDAFMPIVACAREAFSQEYLLFHTKWKGDDGVRGGGVASSGNDRGINNKFKGGTIFFILGFRKGALGVS